MTIHEMLPLIQACLSGTLFILVFWKTSNDLTGRLFSAVLFALTLWGATIFAMRASDNLDVSLLWNRVAIIFVASVSVFFLHFVCRYARAGMSRRLIALTYLYLILFSVLTPTGLLVESMKVDNYGNAPVFGPLFIPFIIPIYLFVLIAIHQLMKSRRKSRSYEERNRFLYFIFAASTLVLAAMIDMISGLGLEIYPVGIIVNSIFALSATFAILRFHLLDIKLATHKATPYFAMFALLSGVYAAAYFMFDHYWENSKAPIWLGLLTVGFITVFLEPLSKQVRYWTNWLFYRGRFEHLKALHKLQEEVQSISDPSKMFTSIPRTIKLAMGASHLWLLVRSDTSDTFETVAHAGFTRHHYLALGTSFPIVKWFRSHKGVLRAEDMENDVQLQALTASEKSLLDSMSAEVWVPMRSRGKLVGMIVLAPRVDGEPYSWEDERLISRVASQMALGFQNIQLYQASLEREKRLAALNAIAQTISQSPDLNQILSNGLDKTLEILQLTHGSIYLIDQESQIVTLKVQQGITNEEADAFALTNTEKGFLEKVASSGQTLYIESLHKTRPFLTEYAFEIINTHQLKSGMFIPLASRGEVMSVMCIFTQGERTFTPEENDLLDTIGHQIGTSFENAILLEEVTKTEALKELDRLRTALLASVSHELRTPLTSIKGIASTLNQTDVEWDPETQKEFLQLIEKESDTLTHIIEDLMQMSQMEAGVMHMDKGQTKISAIVTQVTNQLNQLTSNHQLKINVPLNLPAIYADEIRIGQIVTNLISNAVAYSDKGSLITLEAQLAKDKIQVAVTDQGVGIDSQHMDKVFDRFYRLESGIARRRGGTGLGLAICKGIVEEHGGRIWVESRYGEGSKFFFTLPTYDVSISESLESALSDDTSDLETAVFPTR